MITSKQIVDIIRKEQTKATAPAAIAAYENIINRIEVIEDVEMQNRYSTFGARVSDRLVNDIDSIFK